MVYMLPNLPGLHEFILKKVLPDLMGWGKVLRSERGGAGKGRGEGAWVGEWVGPHLLPQFIGNLRLKQRKDEVVHHLKQIIITRGRGGYLLDKVELQRVRLDKMAYSSSRWTLVMITTVTWS